MVDQRVGSWRSWPVLLGLVAVTVGVPLAVALVVLLDPRGYPGMDLALTELLVRDVGSRDTPLTGLIGRFHALGRRGSHPGPLSFLVLWPLYRLFGSSAWALQAATATLNAVAVGVALWLAHRRGGRMAALGVAVALVVLARAYGAEKLTAAWNPHLPLLWWVVFLLAVWSVLCDDLAVLPLAVFAASLCAQTHLSYLGLTGGVAAVMTGWLVVAAVRERHDGDRVRRLARWGLPSLGLLGLLWLPPVIEQLTGDPGNLAVLRENFTFPDEKPVGWGPALDVWLSYLDVPALLGHHETLAIWARRGSAVPGALLLAVWAGTAAYAWRNRSRQPDLFRLHVVVAAALAFGLVSVARILGILVSWVVLWLWGTTALVLVAVGWTLASAWRDRQHADGPPGAEEEPAAGSAAGESVAVVGVGESAAGARAVPAGRALRLGPLGSVPLTAVVLGAVLLAGAGRFTFEAAYTRADSEANDLLAPLAAMAPETVARLGSGELPGGGVDGHYELRWPSATGTLDAAAYGLVLELERHGFDVRTPVARSKHEVPYRWPEDGDPPVTAVIQYAVGEPDVERWEAHPGAVQVTAYDGREPAALFVLPV